MPMHTSPSIDTDLSRAETTLPRMGPITTSLSLATQTDILGILQREQDHAIALLSSSPLLSSLFVSYASQAAAFEAASATPSPESEEWKTLQNAIATLQEEIKKLKSENFEVTEGLGVAEASREAFRTQVSSLKEVNATQRGDIETLREEVTEAKDKYDRLLADSNAEKAALQVKVLDLETQRAELKEAIIEQQIKISKLGRQGSNPPNPPTAAIPINAAYTRKFDTPEDLNAVEIEPSIISTAGRNKAREQREKEQNEKDVREKKEREARDRVEREEREEKERREKAELQARRKEREEQEHKERDERVEKERIEREAHEQAEREAEERAEREAREQAEREVREQAEKAAREAAKKTGREAREREARERAEEARARADRDAKRKAVKEAREKVTQEAREKAERMAKEKEEREEKERAEREEREEIEREETEKAEREAKEKANREAREREEEEKKVAASKIPSTWGPTVGENDRSRKTSGLSQKEKNTKWASSWDFGSAEQGEHPGLPPIITSSVPGGIFDGPGNLGEFFTTGENDSPGGAEEVELRTPLTKKGINDLSNLSKIAIPTEPVGLGRLDHLEDLNTSNVSARVSVSSENEGAEQKPSPTQPTHPSLAPGTAPEVLSSTTSGLLKTSKNFEGVPTTLQPWPAPPLTPAPAPAKTKPERPLSLWERKKLKAVTQPAPASSLSGGGVVANFSRVLGEAGGSGGNTKSIAAPTLVGDRQPIFTGPVREQKRVNQREDLGEGFLGSNPARRNDPDQPQTTEKPVTKPSPAPAAPPQKPTGWGSWGSSLFDIANQVAAEKSPSPEPFLAKPKIEDLQRGFVPNQPAWSAGYNNTWGAAKTRPTPIARKTSTGSAWSAKPETQAGVAGEHVKTGKSATSAADEFDWYWDWDSGVTKKKGPTGGVAQTPTCRTLPIPTTRTMVLVEGAEAERRGKI